MIASGCQAIEMLSWRNRETIAKQFGSDRRVIVKNWIAIAKYLIAK
jgi:hypothetical protein